ncbi:FAD-binding oxidoreductase [Cohnella sp. WQ 127256]|uniref:NAD(P)/FAD-dependent oxidoreductase n=1 Tax=Cohnella sp. WQ 127256 TaxID=2938790 RepID=UPI0021178B4A|nr:FAD-dependent oxidoreductase [Cohnella sp. WQ 127256]
MSLHFGNLLWPGTYAEPVHYPILDSHKKTRVVIIGGGMSGTLCGYTLAKSGIDTILIEQNTVGSGSTSANTGILQYSNDKMLSDFANSIGEQKAVMFYKACRQAAEHIHIIAEGMSRNVDFKRRSSLYYASTPTDVPTLRQEYEMLHRNGFDADWWEEDQIAMNFPFRKAAAIVTRGDGEINPFLFAQALTEEGHQSGLEVYEKTAMLSVRPSAGGYTVSTSGGEIATEHVIYAVGYVPEQTGRQWAAQINRSYSIVTEPMPSLSDWHERFLLWETSRPYLYLRTTTDNRIIVGGLDENIRQPVLSQQELHAHSLRLLSELHHLFPAITPEIRYEWCATFGESKDGLPWLGEDPIHPGIHYCLAYGGNGTIYSMLAAEIFRDHLLGKFNPIASIVRPDREIVH